MKRFVSLFLITLLIIGAIGAESHEVKADDEPSLDCEWFNNSLVARWSEGPEGTEGYIVTCNFINYDENRQDIYSTRVTETICDFNDFGIDNHNGYYSFSVRALDANNRELADGECQRAWYYLVKTCIETYDENGDQMSGDGGTTTLSINGTSQALSGVQNLYYSNSRATVEVKEIYEGFNFTGMKLNGSVVEGRSASFTIDDNSTTVTVTFQKKASALPLQLELSQKGEQYGEELCAAINEAYPEANAVLQETAIYFQAEGNLQEADVIDRIENVWTVKDLAIEEDPGFSFYVGLKDSYADEDSFLADHSSEKTITESEKFYLLWFDVIDKLELSVKAPICGKVQKKIDTGEDYQMPVYENGLDITVGNDDVAVSQAAWQINEDGEEEPFVGGQKYNGLCIFTSEFGKNFAKDLEIDIILDGEPLGEEHFTSFRLKSGNLLQFELLDIEAVHEYGDWQVVKEPTKTETGLKRRYCTYNPEHYEEEVIDALFVYEIVKGEDGTWEKGSKKDLEFVVKRSYDDSLTFDQFEKVMVDGEELTGNRYSTKKGSLVLDIKEDYLKTLAVGSHTLELIFKDGSCKTGFTIKESSSSTETKEQYKLPLTGVE